MQYHTQKIIKMKTVSGKEELVGLKKHRQTLGSSCEFYTIWVTSYSKIIMQESVIIILNTINKLYYKYNNFT